jgi:glycine/D-amino acid oxidase-like deaminating enzyme
VEGTRGLPFKGQDKTRCLRYPDQATFHPIRYLRGLARALLAHQARLYADTVVESVEEDERGVTVLTERGNAVRAFAAVIATNSPINDRVAIHSKQAPYRTYAMAFTIPRGEMKEASIGIRSIPTTMCASSLARARPTT